MPIYEYLCESCGDKFEKLVRRTEEVLEGGCPSCGQKHLRQEYSTFAARAAGSGDSGMQQSCPAGMCGNPNACGRN